MNKEIEQAPIQVEVGGNISLSRRLTMAEMAKKAEDVVAELRNTVNNRVQYLKRRYKHEFEMNIVDAVTSDRKHVVITYIATRVK